MIEETGNIATCAFCGSTKNLTRDHVPPRNLFPLPRPSDLITVPGCQECNQASSGDDTYFRDMLMFWDGTIDHPEASKVADTVIRSFQRPQQEGYVRSILDRVLDVDWVTPGGIYLGKQEALQFDPSRLNKTVGKIVKGLFFHEFGERLPDHCDASGFFLRNEEEEQTRRWMKETCNGLIAKPRRSVGDGVFTYWRHQLEEDSEKSLWLLLFYEKIPFLGLSFATTDFRITK